MGAASCTHPLDLVKVHLQTQQEARLGMLQMGVRVVKNEGLLGLYAGLSASLLRQATYSTTRFAIYETGDNTILFNSLYIATKMRLFSVEKVMASATETSQIFSKNENRKSKV